MPRALRAFPQAMAHLFLWPWACDFLVTTFPYLFFIKSLFFKPLWVLSLDPRNTVDLARLPLAILETFMALRRFMVDFLAVFFMDFIAFFIDFFMLFAMVGFGKVDTQR